MQPLPSAPQTRRHRLLALTATLSGAVLAAMLWATPSHAQPTAKDTFPSKPLRWIVPFPPGGPTDSFSRPVAQKLSELLGQPVIVENVPGAGASIGMERVARSAPDGYTIGLATTGTHSINPHLYGAKLPHDTSRDFTPLTLALRAEDGRTRRLTWPPGVPRFRASFTARERYTAAVLDPDRHNLLDGDALDGTISHRRPAPRAFFARVLAAFQALLATVGA